MIDNVSTLYEDDFRALFPPDPPDIELGVDVLSPGEVGDHIKNASRIILADNNPTVNFRKWLHARDEGHVLMTSRGKIHHAAEYLVRMFLAFNKHARKHGAALRRDQRSFQVERDFLTAFFAISGELDATVKVPPPFVDHFLKTDAILERQTRKIAVQITTNPHERGHKFDQIHRAYFDGRTIAIPREFRVDDICLLYVDDRPKDFPRLCREFDLRAREFWKQGERDKTYHIHGGEVR